MSYRTTISAEDLREAFEYNPLTGELYRRAVSSSRYKRWIGKRAGGVDIEGYRRVRVLGQHIKEHIVIWCWVTGDWVPEGLEVDHRNRVRTDNRWNNLRLATRRQNSCNCSTPTSNTSGAKGVYLAPHGKYQVRIRIAGKRHYLGQFDTAEEASAAYKAAALELHGEFACLA